MQFITPVDIPKSSINIDHSKKVILLGSCFADNIGQCLAEAKFNVLMNPFGTLYNPLSIAWQIERSMNGKTFSHQDEMLFQDIDGIWHSWMHHSVFSSSSASELLKRMNEAARAMQEALQTAGTLIITFGTAIVYTLKENGRLVANCHKQKDILFHRRRLNTEEITKTWNELLRKLHELNPNLQVVFTVSPIRHQRDGFHTNQISKSVLLIAIDHLVDECRRNGGDFTAEYFPSYEIMMDELRDYRFYAEDMIHPSSAAIQYIWQRFSDSHFDNQTKDIICQCEKIRKAVTHRPNQPGSTTYMHFIENTLKQIYQLIKQHPYICMDKEINLCNTLLRK